MDEQRGSLRQFHFHANSCVSTFAMVFALTLLTTHATQAQTFSVLHNFTGGTDGATPYAGVTVGPGGVLYGTASTVFKLTPHGSSWIFSPLFEFTVYTDGLQPIGGVVIGPNGALYGTTNNGGEDFEGTVFELRPPATVCRSVTCYWNETVVYDFGAGGPNDGAYPAYENLAFDKSGNIYGTTNLGGNTAANCASTGCGTVFELTPSGGGYTETIIHDFGSGTDGSFPVGGVVLDTAGNLYGTTPQGGTEGAGTVYQLMPSNGGWVENVLVNFDGSNGPPAGSLIIDGSGNLYGTLSFGGPVGDGVVFKLAPSGGGFTYSTLYTFTSPCYPVGGLAMDAAGNFFGGCLGGGAHQDGWIFELTSILNDLHDFSGSDGESPYGNVALDSDGNLYGTTEDGGTGNCAGGDGCGVVWEIAGVGAPPKN